MQKNVATNDTLTGQSDLEDFSISLHVFNYSPACDLPAAIGDETKFTDLASFYRFGAAAPFDSARRPFCAQSDVYV